MSDLVTPIGLCLLWLLRPMEPQAEHGVGVPSQPETQGEGAPAAYRLFSPRLLQPRGVVTGRSEMLWELPQVQNLFAAVLPAAALRSNRPKPGFFLSHYVILGRLSSPPCISRMRDATTEHAQINTRRRPE